MSRDDFLESNGHSVFLTEEEIQMRFKNTEAFREKERQKAVETEANRHKMIPKNENEFVKECSEHGRYIGEFSFVSSDKLGTIEESDSTCPICGAECEIISIINFEIKKPVRWDEEEY